MPVATTPPVPKTWTTRIRDSLMTYSPFHSRTPHYRFFDRLLPGFSLTTTVIAVGLDGVGKRTLVRDFLAQSRDTLDLHTETPLVGSDIEVLSYSTVRFHAFDIGGGRPKRYFDMEREQYQIADAIIHVVDVTDRDRLVESREELARGALDKRWGTRTGTPVLVMCNKNDLNGARDASVEEVAKWFQLDGEHEERHPWVRS